MPKSTTKSQNAKKRFAPGSSRGRPDLESLWAQMADALEQADTPAARIRELRAGVPQPVIAAQIPVSLRAYQDWEAGKNISRGNLARLAEIYGVSEEYILYGPDTIRSPLTRIERIEHKLDLILEHLGLDPESAKDQFERELEQAAEQQSEHDADSATNARSRPKATRG